MQTNPINHILRWSLMALVCCLWSCRQPQKDPTEALPFSNDGKSWGLVKTDGTVLQPAGSFGQRPSAVVGGMFSLADDEGHRYLYDISRPTQPVSRKSFARIGHFFEEVAPAQEKTDSPILLIDKRGNEVMSTAQYPQYDIALMHNFSEGRALFATADGKYGYLDTHGAIAVPPIYDRAYDFHEGRALVGNTDNKGQAGYLLIDREGKVQCCIRLSQVLLDTRFSDGRLLYKELHSGHLGYLDKQGDVTVYLPDDIRQASRYAWETATVQTDNGYGLVDINGNLLIPAAYEAIHMAGKGHPALKKDNLWGMVDDKGQTICRFQYDTIGHYYAGGYAVVRQQGRSFFIDRKGNPAGGSTYACIVEDSTASRLYPQCFLTEQSPAGTQGNAPSERPGESDRMSRENDRFAQGKATAKAGQTEHKPSLIERKDWRKVSETNPFYQEAVKVVSGNLDEKDAGNRQMILNYVEHLRTSYTTKDIDFLEQLFSENALIVVGTVVHSSQKETGYLSPAQVVYNIKSKRQYLDRLKQVFQANRTIDVQFSDFHIMRHPTLKGIYGVSLRQGYQSDLYSDDGYLFLLWDFRDETAPKIHVRTWQPRMQADHTPLPENEIFNIRNFNLQ